MPILGVDWSADMLAEFGGDFADASFSHAVSSTRNPASVTGPVANVTANYTCKALGMLYDRRFIDGAEVRRGDLRVIVLRGSIAPVPDPDPEAPIPPIVEPAPRDTITCALPTGDQVTGTVIAVEAITAAFVTVQVRGAGI